MTSPRIVCVDDDPMILRLVEIALRRALSVQVEVFDDSVKAAQHLREGAVPALVILDAMMPRLDGFALCRALRADPRYRSTPIAFLTAGGADHLALARNVGANIALTKPFQPAEFVREIVGVLGLLPSTTEAEFIEGPRLGSSPEWSS